MPLTCRHPTIGALSEKSRDIPDFGYFGREGNFLSGYKRRSELDEGISGSRLSHQILSGSGILVSKSFDVNVRTW